jgi:hypothetical protein
MVSKHKAPQPMQWTLDTGEVVTTRQLADSPKNVHGLHHATIHGRLTRGDRSWKELMRSGDRSIAARRAKQHSPWIKGPNCKTPRAREHYAAYAERERAKGGAA